ncbi:MAG: hypothetical protein ACR2IE_20280 [Candidatus Sumerlaeaceae bacterium]
MSKRRLRKLRHLGDEAVAQERKRPTPEFVKRVQRFYPQFSPTEAGAPAVKSSQLLLEFAKPLMFENDSLEETRKSLELASMAWNLALLPEETRESIMDELPLDEGSLEQDKLIIRQTLEHMIQRKMTHFPQHQRHIAGLTVTMRKNRLHVQVASAMTEGERLART